jgi:hypothetical protein
MSGDSTFLTQTRRQGQSPYRVTKQEKARNGIGGWLGGSDAAGGQGQADLAGSPASCLPAIPQPGKQLTGAK